MSAPRLKYFEYDGTYTYFITICTFNKNPYFLEKENVEFVKNLLDDVFHKNGFEIIGFCFMPDHLHLILSGDKLNNSLIKTINLFKQKTGFYFKKSNDINLWQTSYYDHVIRKEESIKQVLLYVLNNPVRKNLVDDYRKYPYLGSYKYDVNTL